MRQKEKSGSDKQASDTGQLLGAVGEQIPCEKAEINT